MRLLAVVLVAASMALSTTAAQAADVDFKTPGGAAYCVFTPASSFLCFTPNDGWWIRFSGINGDSPRAEKGYDERYRSYHPAGVRTLAFGKTWWSSDAAIVACVSRRSGLTCKHWDGLSFWIGRFRGYRIFLQPAGEKPPLFRRWFRTGFDVRCGLGAGLEPNAPYVSCWRASDGLQLTLARGARASFQQNGNARGYRPSGFRLLPSKGSFRWTCRSVDDAFATGCTANGPTTPVFTCIQAGGRLTCRSDSGHGFWVSRTSFYAF